MTVGILASIIAALLLLQIAVAALVGLSRRKRRPAAIDVGQNSPQTQSPAGESALSGSGPQQARPAAWTGFREFRIARRVVEDRAGTICSYYLVPVDGLPLPAFKPGQYLTFRLTTEDPVTRQPKALVRCYSLSDRPRPDYYRVSIKRVLAPADRPEAPPGLSSNYFHDHVREGNILEVKAPSGHFYLMEEEPLPIVLVGGGIGITPMLSIVNTLLERGSRREIWLFYGVRNGSEAVLKSHLQRLDREHGNFHLQLCYSKPDKQEQAGIDYQHSGRVDIPLLRSTLKLMRYQFYVCGPKPMMESLVPGLASWRVESRDIFYESFGPATLIRHEKPMSVNAEPITVTFGQSDRRIAWSAKAASLLELAEENGVDVASGCRAGSCGSCQTRLIAGEVEYQQQPAAEIEPGHCLLCISTPKCDITLAA